MKEEDGTADAIHEVARSISAVATAIAVFPVVWHKAAKLSVEDLNKTLQEQIDMFKRIKLQ